MSGLQTQGVPTCMWELTSVSCSRCPIKDRDSPSSCRWAAASMGSTSGTRAGDRDTVPGALFGDTIPVPVPTTFMTKHNWKARVMRAESERTKTWEMIKLSYQSVWDFAVTVKGTFAFALIGCLVFDCGGLSFILLVLQILSFLPPNLHRRTNRKHRCLVNHRNCKHKHGYSKAFLVLITNKGK